MSKATEQEAFEAWKAEFAASLTDPEKKAAFDKVADLDIFKGHLRTQDYHRKLNELDVDKKKHQEEYKKMGDWYRQAQTEAAKIQEENTKLKAAHAKRAKADDLDDLLDDGATRTTDDPPAGTVKKEDFEALAGRLQALDQGAPAYTNTMLKLATRALKENLDFDPDKLFEAAQNNRCDLERAFDILSDPIRKERAEADVKARIEKAREEARAEALSSIPPDRVRAMQPAPPAIAKLFGDTAQASPLQGDPVRISAAVEEYNRMMQQGGGS